MKRKYILLIIGVLIHYLAIFSAKASDSLLLENMNSIKLIFEQRGEEADLIRLLEQNEAYRTNDVSRDSLKSLSHYYASRYYYSKGDYDKFSNQVDQLLNLLDTNWTNSAQLYFQVAESHYSKGHYDSTITALNRTYQLASNRRDTVTIKSVFRLQSVSYNYLNKPLKGIEVLQKLVKLAESTNDHGALAGAYINLGLSYYDSDFMEEAIVHFSKAITETDSLKSERQRNHIKTYAINNLGNVYSELNRCDTAILLHKQALSITDPNNLNMLAYGNNGLGQCLYDQENYSEALPYLKTAYEVFSKVHYPEPKVSSATSYASALIKLNRMNEALPILKDAYETGVKLKTFESVVEAALNLALIYEENQNLKDASYFYNEAINYKDSVRENYKDQAVAELNIKFETERKDAENMALREQNKLKDSVIEQKNTINLMMGSIAGLVILILVVVFLNRSKLRIVNAKLKKQQVSLSQKNTKLSEMNVNNERLLAIISHDLKGPIGSMEALLSYVLEEEDIEIKDNCIRAAQSSMIASYDLLNSLLNWARNEKGLSRYIPENIHLLSVTEEILALYNYQIEEKRIALKVEIEPLDLVYSDIYMLKTILRNLLTNAVKFTDVGGQITIGYQSESGIGKLYIRDNGLGMTPAQKEAVLSESASGLIGQGTSGEVGTGLGLRLVKDMVDRHGGSLTIESESGKGSTFIIKFPKEVESSVLS